MYSDVGFRDPPGACICVFGAIEEIYSCGNEYQSLARPLCDANSRYLSWIMYQVGLMDILGANLHVFVVLDLRKRIVAWIDNWGAEQSLLEKYGWLLL